MERTDAEGFVTTAPGHDPMAADEALPLMQDFATVLYRGIADGLPHLVGRFGERAEFVGAPRAQARPSCAIHAAKVNVAHDRELFEVVRLAIDVGTHVEQCANRSDSRGHVGNQGRPIDPR